MRLKFRKNMYMICTLVTIIIVFTVILSKNFSTYNMKYVLIWTSPNSEPFAPLAVGSRAFYRRSCPIQNCYITSDKRYLDNITAFDAILFHGPEILSKTPKSFLPKERSSNQSYIFTSMESSHNYNAPDTRFRGVFNFTWSYKLNSDISFRYMVIRDHEGKVIGPNETMDWINVDDMIPINETIKEKLSKKIVAAAWFVSNCRSYSGREILALKIAAELQRHRMAVHIYGSCGRMQCPRNSMAKCLKLLQRDYYFYFAFENSLADDYVTEKLRNALQNYVVPIVYGAANYRRFMPDGIYIDATKMSIERLVKYMVTIIENKYMYYEFFKWHNHYSYHHPEETPETDPYCSLCSFINKVNRTEHKSVENFFNWWNSIEIMNLIERHRKKRH